MTDIKSQDELTQDGRSVEVLTNTIDELAKVKKQLEIAVEVLEEYANEDHWCGCIAGFNPRQIDSGCYGCYGFTEAQEALIKIKDVEK